MDSREIDARQTIVVGDFEIAHGQPPRGDGHALERVVPDDLNDIGPDAQRVFVREIAPLHDAGAEEDVRNARDVGERVVPDDAQRAHLVDRRELGQPFE